VAISEKQKRPICWLTKVTRKGGGGMLTLKGRDVRQVGSSKNLDGSNLIQGSYAKRAKSELKEVGYQIHP